MYSFSDFLLALLWGILALILYLSREWLKSNLPDIEARNADDEMKVAVIKMTVPTLFVASVVSGLLCIGTLLLPLLSALVGAVMEKVYAFLEKYGGFLIIIGCIVIWWKESHPKQKTEIVAQPPKPSVNIDEIRTRAERNYPIMQQTAYILFKDICRYFSGLVSPFSLSAVDAPVKFDVLPGTMLIVYHFVLGKGNCDASADTIRKTLESIIDQRLQAKELPLIIEPIYVSADGSTWSSLVVDGVYDLNQNFRIDLIITNEAEVARLKAHGLANFADGANTAQPNDPDFS